MKTTRFKHNGIEYINCKTYVNVETGEEIEGTYEWIKENYKIQNKTKKITYGYLNKITWETYEILTKPVQLKIQL